MFGVMWGYPYLTGSHYANPLTIDDKTIYRIFDSTKIDMSSKTAFDQLYRLALDADISSKDRAEHRSLFKKNGVDATLYAAEQK